MKLLEYEVSIKSKIEENKDDSEIYDLIQKMVLMFLRRKKVCRDEKDREDLSFIIAGDMYMKILDGERFSYYLGYLDKIYREYINKFYEGSKDQIQLDSSIDLSRSMFINSTTYDYCRLNNKVYLSEIYRVIDELMDETCKYKRKSNSYNNLKLSLILSIIRDELTGFHINEEQLIYLRLLLSRFYSKVKEESLNIENAFFTGG